MRSFWTAWLVAITSGIVVPLTASAEAGINSAENHAAKPPVGDFGPARNMQIQIIDDAPVVHDYRPIPQAPVIQENWKQSAFADLWNATWKRSPDLQFVISKLCFNNESKAIITHWLVDLGTESPQLGPRLRPEVRPPADIDDESTPFYSGKLRKLTKSGHATSELVAIVQMVENERERLDTTYKQYMSEGKEASELARSPLVRMAARATLLQMAGPDAIERLDRAIAENSCPEKVGQPWPNGPMAPRVFPEKPRQFHSLSEADKAKRATLMYVGDFDQSF